MFFIPFSWLSIFSKWQNLLLDPEEKIAIASDLCIMAFHIFFMIFTLYSYSSHCNLLVDGQEREKAKEKKRKHEKLLNP